jgi:hypothetical protein
VGVLRQALRSFLPFLVGLPVLFGFQWALEAAGSQAWGSTSSWRSRSTW